AARVEPTRLLPARCGALFRAPPRYSLYLSRGRNRPALPGAPSGANPARGAGDYAPPYHAADLPGQGANVSAGRGAGDSPPAIVCGGRPLAVTRRGRAHRLPLYCEAERFIELLLREESGALPHRGGGTGGVCILAARQRLSARATIHRRLSSQLPLCRGAGQDIGLF